MPNQVFQISYTLRIIVGLPEMRSDTPRLPLHETSRDIWLMVSIIASIGWQQGHSPVSESATTTPTGRFRLWSHCVCELDSCTDQTMIACWRLLDLYTDACSVAVMHSRHLIWGKNGQWLCGTRHVPGQEHILICYNKPRLKRQVSSFIVCDMASHGFSAHM